MNNEMSMIGLGLFGHDSLHARQAVAGRQLRGGDGERCSGMFGGLNIILVGDPMQLLPVGTVPISSATPGMVRHTVEGRRTWLGVNA